VHYQIALAYSGRDAEFRWTSPAHFDGTPTPDFEGAAAGWNLAPKPELETIVTTASVLTACGVSTVVGVVFGIHPATKASRVNPIEAPRYEWFAEGAMVHACNGSPGPLFVLVSPIKAT